MANLNRVTLIGNLTRDPELRHTPKGTAVAELGMAINRVWKDDGGNKQEETTFVDVTLWGRTAELAQQYLHKGSSCYIEGRLVLESWDDKATGHKRSKLKVVGENMQFLDSKQRQESSDRAKAPARSPNQNGARPPEGARSAEFGQSDIGGGDLDDIPFAPNRDSMFY